MPIHIYVGGGPGGGGGGLPAGVTLVPPDGGVDYYANNGFTYGAAAGFDSAAIPIGPWDMDGFAATAQSIGSGTGWPALWAALNWNFIAALYSGLTSPEQTILQANGIYLAQYAGLTFAGSETTHIYAADEASAWSTATGPIGSTSAALQAGRPFWLNGTCQFVNGNGDIVSGTPSSRSDGSCSTNGTSVVTDSAITQADWGKTISCSGHIPAGCFIIDVPTSGQAIIGTMVLDAYGTPVLTEVNASNSASGLTFVVGAVNPGIASEVMSYPVETPTTGVYRHLDIPSADIYFMTVDPAWTYQDVDLGQDFFQLGAGVVTQDQYQRGSNYGLAIDALRLGPRNPYIVPQPFSAPIFSYLETGNPFEPTGGGSSSYNIQPAQFNWAAWASIIHGARGLAIFDHYLASVGTTTDLNMNTTYAQTASNYPTGPTNPNGVSMYTQVGLTCGAIQALAPVINDNNAAGYLTITSTGAAGPSVAWPTCVGNATDLFSGIDTMVKYHAGSFYVFVCTRNSISGGPYTVDFQLADHAATEAQIVYTTDSSTSPISISGGAFSDTLTNGASVRVYKIIG